MSVAQGSPNYGLRAKSSPRRHFVNDEKEHIYKKLVDLVKCDIFGNSHITNDVRPSDCSVKAYVALGQKVWRPWCSH